MPFMSFADNRNFFGLLGASTLLGLVMPMLIILGGLAGMMLAPTAPLSTLPASLQALAGLIATGPFSLLMGRFGRRTGFLVGGGLAIAGGLVGVWAMALSSFALLCVAHVALGAALASYQYFRFAAAEVVRSDWQPVAISLMLTSGLVAAFAGPQIFIVARNALAPIPFAGAYAAIAVISLIGLVPLALVRIATVGSAQGAGMTERFAALSILRRGPVRAAVGIGAVAQGIMVFLMVPTPLAMVTCGFAEAITGDVIRWHVVAMFAPSFFTGFLIKRFGTRPIVTTGLILLTASAIAAATGISSAHFYGAMVLLGLGWNFGFIGATQMLTQAVAPAERAVAQGANDTVIALASTICAFAAGALVAGFGWAVASLLPLPVLAWALGSMMKRRPAMA